MFCAIDKEMFMKRVTWIVLLLAVTTMMFAVDGTIAVSTGQTGVQLLSNSQSGMTVQYSVSTLAYQTVASPQGNFTDINIEGYSTTNRTGLPKLPLMRQIIRVPLNANVIPRVVYSTSDMVSLSGNGIYTRILPRQESIAKNVDAALVPFVINRDFYNGTNWTNEPTIKVEEIGMMRGARLVALDFTPVQYNPATAQLQVITSASIEVSFAGADWAATDELYRRYYSSAFESVLAQTVFNYETQRVSLDRYPLGMIIVTPQSYIATLQPFVDWKKMQGYNVTIATTDVVGTTTSAIKTYLQNIWNSATVDNPAPSYLLIVGDTPQVPAWTGATGGGHVTDLNYVRLQGTDYVPEMYFGRFSAINTTQVQAYVDKSLQYEMYTMPDPSYLSHTVLIAGVDAGMAPTYGNGQINYGKNNYFGESSAPNWTPYGPYQIRNHMYYYPASGSSESQIIADMNNGLSFINYTAHGSETSWSDPSLTIANVNSLTNANKYFVSIGNCCLTNAFDTGECFGEAFTRAPNKGAVAYIGGTNVSYWDEDYYWAVGYKPPVVGTGSPYIPNRIGAYDALFHTHSEAFADWASTMGSMNFMGNMAIVASNSSRANYYWEIYSIMGDPSLVPYMGIPTEIEAEYSPNVTFGVGTMQIMADPFTYVAISKDNVLHGAGLTDETGALTLNFTPFSSPGQAKLVMTRSLRQPLIADLVVTTSSGPYLLVNNMIVNDGNNAIAESGETLYLDVTLNNVGTEAAQGVTATLTSSSPYVNIISGTANVANIASNASASITATFQVAISPAIPDQQIVEFIFNMTDNDDNNWTATRNLTVNAPNVTIGSPTFFDPNNNGAFEPGETITVNVNLTNTGHMNAGSGYLQAVINSPNASLGQSSFTLPGFNMGVNIPISLSVTIAPNTPLGAVIPIGLALTAGSQLVNSMIALPVGATSEGFEPGNFGSFPWVNNSLVPWTIVSGAATAHSGNYCAKSGAINHNGITELSITLNVSSAGNISFWRKVSSESGYDFLKFYIDGSESGSWSGNQSWAQQTYPVSAGSHTFKWEYSKDYSTVSGSDCAWIDDVVFPMSGDSNVPIFYSPVTELNFNDVPVNSTVSQDFLIRNLGQAPLTGTINAPQIVELLEDGITVSDIHNYSIPANSNKLYTVKINVTSVIDVDDNILIVSNDPNYQSHQIAVHLNSVGNSDPTVIPIVTKLDGNYPNPFNPVTSIRFSTKEQGNVSIIVYNSKGQVVRTLVNEHKKAGNHAVIWNGADDNGKPVSSGLYLYKMQAKGYTQLKKMMLMK
jgi:hypothetical protein